MSDTEYDPTPDMLQKNRKNEKLILELPKLPWRGAKHAKKKQQGLTPSAALKEVEEEKKALNFSLDASSSNSSKTEKQHSRNSENNNGSKVSEASQKNTLSRKKRGST